ncbi:hypothetical protein [Burkholderia catarinensis]|uniref:hypothetical protein n=1 Tax=Burkholderia catarinensis TaxID=1108140 RepID=UPI00090FA35A|nr:hypothetical protein [Burkholderia catarinensis]KAG8148763.1 hypothetical protein BFF94_036155 [Burkholderia catarinensis]
MIAFQEPASDANNDASPVLVRTYLSATYLTRAELMAQQAHAIETGPAVKAGRSGFVEREPHLAYASSAIIMSALAVEAFVNELFADCAAANTSNLFGVPAREAHQLAQVWRHRKPMLPPRHKPRGKGGRGGQSQRKPFEIWPTLDKYDQVLQEFRRPLLDREAEPVKAMATLLQLRNALVHYKLVARTMRGPDDKWPQNKLEQQLRLYFPDDNPMTGLNNAFIPDRVVGHTAAEWSIQTAAAFLEHIRLRLVVTPRIGYLWPARTQLPCR